MTGEYKLPEAEIDNVITVLVAARLTDDRTLMFTVHDRELLRGMLNAVEPQHSIREMAAEHYRVVRDYVLSLPKGVRGVADPDVESYRKMLVETPRTKH